MSGNPHPPTLDVMNEARINNIEDTVKDHSQRLTSMNERLVTIETELRLHMQNISRSLGTVEEQNRTMSEQIANLSNTAVRAAAISEALEKIGGHKHDWLKIIGAAVLAAVASWYIAGEARHERKPDYYMAPQYQSERVPPREPRTP